jgi:hypothetical protein
MVVEVTYSLVLLAVSKAALRAASWANLRRMAQRPTCSFSTLLVDFSRELAVSSFEICYLVCGV